MSSSLFIQSYIQSFRDRQVQAQPFPGRLVGGANALVDGGYDCGATSPLTGATGALLRVWPGFPLQAPSTRDDLDSATSPTWWNHIKAPLGIHADIVTVKRFEAWIGRIVEREPFWQLLLVPQMWYTCFQSFAGMLAWICTNTEAARPGSWSWSPEWPERRCLKPSRGPILSADLVFKNSVKFLPMKGDFPCHLD